MESDTSKLKSVGKHGAKWLRSKYAAGFLALISLIESSFAPILVDPFLIALILARRNCWVYYTIITIIFSVLGGLLAYALGIFFFDTIGERFITFYALEDELATITNSVNDNAFVFVLLGALTPIPYKLVAIASGLLQVDLLTFVVASIFGRSLRMALVGYITYLIGPKVIALVQKRMLTIIYALGFILIIYIIIQSVID